MLRSARCLTPLAAAVFCLPACSTRPDVESLSGLAQGTTYSVQWSSETAVDESTLQAALAAELERIDELLSNYRADSTIERFNAAQTVAPQALPAELVSLLRVAADVHRASDGCFDPTVRPLVRLWGFDGDEPHVPTATEIESARERVGFDKLEIPSATEVRKTVPGIEVDMSSIGQGYTVSRLAAVVEGFGIDDYVVEIGGELRARGQKPGREPWRLGVEDPSPAGGVAEPLVAAERPSRRSDHERHVPALLRAGRPYLQPHPRSADRAPGGPRARVRHGHRRRSDVASGVGYGLAVPRAGGRAARRAAGRPRGGPLRSKRRRSRADRIRRDSRRTGRGAPD